MFPNWGLNNHPVFWLHTQIRPDFIKLRKRRKSRLGAAVLPWSHPGRGPHIAVKNRVVFLVTAKKVSKVISPEGKKHDAKCHPNWLNFQNQQHVPMLLSQISLWELQNLAAERREAAKEISAHKGPTPPVPLWSRETSCLVQLQVYCYYPTVTIFI